MKKIIAGLLIAVSLSACFPVFVPVGHGHYHHGYHHDYRR